MRQNNRDYTVEAKVNTEYKQREMVDYSSDNG